MSLKQLVFDRRRVGDKVILLAASGGGTRAALYTASALRGIAALGRLDDVVLVGGVSGGSAALAYFAIHRDQLLQQAPGSCTAAELERVGNGDASGVDAWCVYIAAMARPYIEDVLRGALRDRHCHVEVLRAPAERGVSCAVSASIRKSRSRWRKSPTSA
ncbi:MAG: hypothetical protein MZV70_39710 [Desulfobacterales bacterium]|nr:hypothetical protein [Desulfobacterales bacterium]